MTSTFKDIAKRRAWLGEAVVGAVLVTVFFLLPAGSIPQSTVYDILGLAAIAAALMGLYLHRPDA